MQRRGTSRLGGFAVLALPLALCTLDCSGTDTAPFAANDCTGLFCGPGRTAAQSGPGGRASTALDAGISSGGFASTLGCATDPASGLVLCRTIVSCPGFTLDVNAFPGCGLVSQPQGIQLNCVCSGTQICPLGFAATCSDLTQLFSSTGVGVTNELCTQAIAAGTCRNIGNVRTVGATCDRNCAVACGNVPACIAACGC